MSAKSEKMRIASAIALHEPEKLYERNKGMLEMNKKQLHDFAIKSRKSTKGSEPFSPEELQKGFKKIGN